LLAAATAVFLWSALEFIAGNAVKRAAIAVLCGGLLLGPLVVVWPANIMTESLTLTALLLFASACLAYDADKKYSLALIGLSCCLLVLIRDPIIGFVWMFAGLLWLNILLARKTRMRAAVAGVALLLAVGLGLVRAPLVAASGKYYEPFANVLQLRMLPDPERRAFFVEHGLPMSPTVMERSGKASQFNGTLFLPDSQVGLDFAAYRNWIVANGFRTYAAFLLTHPGYLVRSIFVSPNIGPPDQFARDFSYSLADLFSLPQRGYWIELMPYSPWLRDFLLAPLGWLVPMLYLGVVVVRYAGRTTGRRRASCMETAALAAGVALFVTYHTDALDPWRHAVPFLMLIYLSLIVRAAEIVQDLTRWGRQWLASRPADAAPVR